MKCWKCGKEMDREDGGTVLKGVVVTIDVTEEHCSKDDIVYYNKQLGKYSSGQGGCKVGCCYECYIDGLFNLTCCPELIYSPAYTVTCGDKITGVMYG